MNNQEYKLYHESFMRNNDGSSSYFVFMAVLLSFMLVAIAQSVTCNYPSPRTSTATSFLRTVIVEILLIIFPLILCMTLLSDYLLVTFAICIIFSFWILGTKVMDEQYIKYLKSDTNVPVYAECLTNSRALIYLYTTLCILAVDFKIFPRYFAKTETYGYSLMDTGVGFFIFSSAIVSKVNDDGKISQNRKSNIKLIIILIVIGIARYVTLSKLDYQQHVTEYGVHWNFFITLAVTKLSTFFIMNYINVNKLFLCSVSVLIIHEIILQFGASEWVMSDVERNNFLNANREGISSCLGYIFLYLSSAYISISLWQKKKTTKVMIMKRLFFHTVILWLLALCSGVFIPSSRRLANSSYCFYVSAISFSILFMFYVMETLFSFHFHLTSVPLIFGAINRNGISYFLIANISTGIINMSMQTLFLNNLFSLLILNLYMIFTTAVILYLDAKNIKL